MPCSERDHFFVPDFEITHARVVDTGKEPISLVIKTQANDQITSGPLGVICCKCYLFNLESMTLSWKLVTKSIALLM
jgi:hypothetical protein